VGLSDMNIQSLMHFMRFPSFFNRLVRVS